MSRWIALGLVTVASVGCHRNNVQMPDGNLPTSQGRTSLLSGKFGSNSGFTPQAPATNEKVVFKTPRKPGQGLKPETEVEFAVTEIEAAYMEGRTAVERDQLLDSARQRFRRALTAEPKNRAALIGLARFYADSDNKDQAIATLRQAMQYYPKDHELAHRLATIQIRFEDYAGAMSSCQQALALDPENRIYTKTLGFCQAHQNDYQAAFATMLKVMPEPQARYFLGRVLIDTNRMNEGKDQIQAAIAADPNYGPAKQFLEDMNNGRPASNDGIVPTSYQEPAK